ncbi:MAG: aldo/keto reductase [Pseudomonadota bacterium]
MTTRPFGSDGLSVAVIGQGTWRFERDEQAAARALHRGIELGLRHVDTAEIYGDGAVEAMLGRALAGVRDRVFLVSKVDPRRATRDELPRACVESLRRLRTDHLDAYLLHWLPPHPLAGAVEALEALVRAGHIGCWGVSNFDEVKLGEIIELAGPGRVACNQVLYHLGCRDVEHAVLPFCQRHGVAMVGYSPFATGAFPAPDSPPGRELAHIARARGATPRQLALAFLTRHPGSFTIPRASAADHVEENAGAATLTLSAETVAALERLFPLGPRRPGVPTL